MQPLLTVLMPVFNAERFLHEAIQSILQQTFTAFEFLIIDDGSTDNSVAIIKSYNDSRIRLIKNEQNLGISATLNKGLRLASADLVARMDADDISYPERLHKQVEYMSSDPDCALLSTWAQVVTEEKTPLYTEKYRTPYYYYNLTFSCWIYHPTIVYRRSAVLDAGGYQSTYAEDYDLFWHLLRKHKIHNLEEVLLDYRITTQSLHQVLKKKEYDEAMAAQILRNFRHYAGTSFLVSHEEMQCLRFDFGPMLQSNRVTSILNAFSKLDLLTKGILSEPNPNRDVRGIREAYYFRRKFMKDFFVRNLPPLKGIWLRIMLKLRGV